MTPCLHQATFDSITQADITCNKHHVTWSRKQLICIKQHATRSLHTQVICNTHQATQSLSPLKRWHRLSHSDHSRVSHSHNLRDSTSAWIIHGPSRTTQSSLCEVGHQDSVPSLHPPTYVPLIHTDGAEVLPVRSWSAAARQPHISSNAYV